VTGTFINPWPWPSPKKVRDYYAKEPTDMKLEAKDSTLNSNIINWSSNLFGSIPFQR